MKTTHVELQFFYKKGYQSPREISKITGISLRTVERIYSKLKKGCSLERKKGSGRVRKFKKVDRQRLSQLVIKDDTKTSFVLAKEMASRGSPSVHPNTILNYLHRSGFSKFSPKKMLDLTLKHKMNRVKWCMERRTTRWHNWIFSDECRFELYDMKGKRWGKTRPQVSVPKFGPSIMIWGAISSTGKSKLIFIKGTVTSQKYQEIMAEAEESLLTLQPKSFVFQQDGATSHTSKSTSDWLQKKKWTVSSWPANSADLNPIENLWGLIKNEVRKRKIKDVEHLKTNIQEIWDGISITTIKLLIQSMPKRIETCIEEKGGQIKY